MQIENTLIDLEKIINHKTAIKDLIFLSNNPNKEIPYFYLENCRSYFQEPTVDDVHLNIIIDATKYFIKNPIYLCDETTVDQVKKRLNKLLNHLEIEKDLGNKQLLFDLEKERKALVKYLSEVITWNGKLRAFTNPFQKPKRTFIKNLKHTLEEIKLLNPELVKEIKKNLIISRYTVKWHIANI